MAEFSCVLRTCLVSKINVGKTVNWFRIRAVDAQVNCKNMWDPCDARPEGHVLDTNGDETGFLPNADRDADHEVLTECELLPNILIGSIGIVTKL